MKKTVDIMAREVITVRPDTPVRDLARTLSRKRISAVPVVDEAGCPVGVVSSADLTRLAARTEGGTLQPAEHEFYRPGRLRVDLPEQTAVDDLTAGELMNRLVVSVEEHTDLREVLDLMLSFQIHRVLVTRKGELVGLVSTLDIVRAFREHLRLCGGDEAPPPVMAGPVGDMAEEMDALVEGPVVEG